MPCWLRSEGRSDSAVQPFGIVVMMPETTSTWTFAQYEAAISEFGKLWGAPTGTVEGDRLDLLASLIDLFENQHYPSEKPKPDAALVFQLSNTAFR